jgi:hypothetical protein
MDEGRRLLSSGFVDALKSGSLKSFLDYVLADDSLLMEIRKEYLNIYYRGGSLFRISPSGKDYTIFFDLNYCDKRRDEIACLNNTDFDSWIENIPIIKAEMDSWFCGHQRLEREFQQLVARENNCSTVSQGTDYFITDIEYANSENHSKFDMLAVKWKSGSERRTGKKASLSFVEVKYGDHALRRVAGLRDHIKDLVSFLDNPARKRDILSEVTGLFNQKRSLGLLKDTKRDIDIQDSSPLEFILLLANHNPSSTILKTELSLIRDSDHYKKLLSLGCELKIATASYLGYGLYDQNMIPLEVFLDKMSDPSW